MAYIAAIPIYMAYCSTTNTNTYLRSVIIVLLNWHKRYRLLCYIRRGKNGCYLPARLGQSPAR